MRIDYRACWAAKMKPDKLKIAVVVHGRFYAFDLVRELILKGHDVTLFTNYPKFITAKYGIPKRNIKSFLFHGLLSRFLSLLNEGNRFPAIEIFTHTLFSRWAKKQLLRSSWDLVAVFSGVASEIFEGIRESGAQKVLIRGSTHIATQSRLLEEEEKRAGSPVSRPSQWMVSRELKEYRQADKILVLSTFAYDSFLQEGVERSKLELNLLGSKADIFRPNKNIIDERVTRILSGQPLRVLMVGAFIFRKGAIDLMEIASRAGKRFLFRVVGEVAGETKVLIEKYQGQVEFISKQKEFDLPISYSWADIFIFPTIEDGYPVVLAQAQASGLPLLVTQNCSGPDIVIEDKTGWTFPIRHPELFLERLQWCEEHRKEMADMVRYIYTSCSTRGWDKVALDFEKIYKK